LPRTKIDEGSVFVACARKSSATRDPEVAWLKDLAVHDKSAIGQKKSRPKAAFSNR